MMHRSRMRLFFVALGVAAFALASQAQAQAPATLKEFAKGVVTTIEPAPQDEEMFSGPRPLVEVPIEIEGLEYDPQLSPKTATVFERAKIATLRRTIWNLEFSFKPMRMVYVDIPQPDGKMQRKLVWYMVYYVRNLGNHIRPKAVVEEVIAESPVTDANGKVAGLTPGLVHVKYDKETTNEVEVFGKTTTELRFFPHFVLKSTEYKDESGKPKEYLDQVIPAALEPIKAREFPGRDNVTLYNSLTISEVPIPVSDGTTDNRVWGVVTWVDIDPRIDYYIVYVQGLTNAYQYEDPAGAFKKGDLPGSGRKIVRKTLQLNFWRPGDTVDPSEEEIRYGCRIDSDEAEQQKIFAQFEIDKPI
ncbi:MAG TPA: hypothetical protein VFV87_22530, partial [Pirellulaceae bacterium]|nr:hypothetical protein [Pirellulaceae bacterium]